MRYSTKYLYGINPRSRIGKPYDEVLLENLEALKDKKKELSKILKCEDCEYEKISAVMYELMYVDGAIEDHKFLLDEIEISYE